MGLMYVSQIPSPACDIYGVLILWNIGWKCERVLK